ncbi:MAG: phenylacetaldoxime dehydratase family protein [Sulfitobacter sp.]
MKQQLAMLRSVTSKEPIVSETIPRNRIFPMKKPDGHVAGTQRYSAQLANNTKQVQVLYLGVQNHDGTLGNFNTFLDTSRALFADANGSVHYDYAKYLDPEGVPTLFAVAYWMAPEKYEARACSDLVAAWWADPAKLQADTGYFWEAFRLTKDHGETISFKKYIRGLSTCPMHSIYPMDESGYWGPRVTVSQPLLLMLLRAQTSNRLTIRNAKIRADD